MRELYPYSSMQDRYLMSLLDMLKTKYTNVEVLRGREQMTFYYTNPTTGITDKSIIPREVIEMSMSEQLVPAPLQKILNLCKPN